MIKVTVWCEFIQEKTQPEVTAIYPDGIHTAIAEFLSLDSELVVRTACLEQPEHGLTDEVLADTDVLIWWGHTAHDRVADEIVDRVQNRVLMGMGLMVLHSGHLAKPLRRMLGTACTLRWREIGENERLWNIAPGHPITQGIGDFVDIPHEEMYGECFDIPTPDELVLLGWFKGGEVFRSGCVWNRGYGKVFYFQPGHETYPIYRQPEIQTIITNGVKYLYQPMKRADLGCPNVQPLEEISL